MAGKQLNMESRSNLPNGLDRMQANAPQTQKGSTVNLSQTTHTYSIPVSFQESAFANYGHSNLQHQSSDMLRLVKFGLMSEGYDTSNVRLGISNKYPVDSNGRQGFDMMLSGSNAPKSVIGKFMCVAMSYMMNEFNNQLMQQMTLILANQELMNAQQRLENANQRLALEYLKFQNSMIAAPEHIREAKLKELEQIMDKYEPLTHGRDVLRSYGIDIPDKEYNEPKSFTSQAFADKEDSAGDTMAYNGTKDSMAKIGTATNTTSSIAVTNAITKESAYSVAGTKPSAIKSLGRPNHPNVSSSGGNELPNPVAVAGAGNPPKPPKTASDSIVLPESSDEMIFKEGVLAFGKGKFELGDEQYQPDNTLSMLRGNCNAFTKNVLDNLRSHGAIGSDKDVDLKIGFGDPYTSLFNEKYFVSHVAFNDIGVPDNVMAKALEFAAAKTIGDLSEQAKTDVKKHGLRYAGPDVSDAMALKCEDVHNIGEGTYNTIMRAHDKSLGKAAATTMQLMHGEPYPCPDKKVALHKDGAIGITLSNDGNAPKTVDDYRTKICNDLNALKDAIDDELGLSIEESRKCTIDISRTFKNGEKSEFMIAFSGYDGHAEELQSALSNSMNSMFNGQLSGGENSFFQMAGNEKRISPQVLNDTTRFESPDIYHNATGLTTADGHSLLKYGDRTFTTATLNETLLPSESQSLENSGMQL